MVEVKLIEHTPNPEDVLVKAFSECYQKPANIEVVVKNFRHQSVLEHVSFTFRAKISRACLGQLTRHRTFSFTVESQRYVDYSEGFDYHISSAYYNNPEALMLYKEHMKKCVELYKTLRKLGMKKEDARGIMPMESMCNLTFTVDLRNLIHFWQLRLDPHAQEEIRVLATEMLRQVLELLPRLKDRILQELENGH